MSRGALFFGIYTYLTSTTKLNNVIDLLSCVKFWAEFNLALVQQSRLVFLR